MFVTDEYLNNVFKKVKNLREDQKAYTIGYSDSPAISVDDLVYTAERMYQFNVRLIKVNARRLNFVKAKLFRLDGSPENPHQIRIRVDLTPYEARFAVTKELSHLIIDEPEDWCTDGRQIIDEMFELYGLERAGNGDTTPQRKIISENIAEMAATEFLYPHRFRAGDLAALSSSPPSTTMGKLENCYELPAPIISRALSKWYIAIADKIWANLN